MVDDYNALFGPTDMHEVLGPRKRGKIKAGETRLCAALRDASDIVRSGAVYLGATSTAVQLGYRLSESLGHECGADGSQVLEREQCPAVEHKGNSLVWCNTMSAPNQDWARCIPA